MGETDAAGYGIVDTIVTPCRVPWAISPTDSLVSLRHLETMSSTECAVVLGANSMSRKRLRVEIEFDFCSHTRTGPHDDSEGIAAIGYKVDWPFEGSLDDDHELGSRLWAKTGFCPDSGFYVARQSPWLQSLADGYQRDCRHYVVYGRDGHVELVARRFKWRAWHWPEWTDREEAPKYGPVVCEGEGVE